MKKQALFGFGAPKVPSEHGFEMALNGLHEDIGHPLPEKTVAEWRKTAPQGKAMHHGWNHFSDHFNKWLSTSEGKQWNEEQAAKHRSGQEKTAFWVGFEKRAFGKYEIALDTPEKQERYKKQFRKSVNTTAAIGALGGGVGSALHHVAAGGSGKGALLHGLVGGAATGLAGLVGGHAARHFKEKKSLADKKVTGYGFDRDVAQFRKKIEGQDS